MSPSIADQRKHQLIKYLMDCDERKAFIEEEKKTKEDPEFEKYFRSAAMEFFLLMIHLKILKKQAQDYYPYKKVLRMLKYDVQRQCL